MVEERALETGMAFATKNCQIAPPTETSYPNQSRPPPTRRLTGTSESTREDLLSLMLS
jgi:hypothetical protein